MADRARDYIVFLVQCDEQGRETPETFPKWMSLRVQGVKELSDLPQVGDELFVALDMEPDGSNEGEAYFIVRRRKIYLDQASVESDLIQPGRINLYVQPLEDPKDRTFH